MLEALLTARQLLDRVTPLAYDCGRLCSDACCKTDADDQGGVWLFPGEEEVDYSAWGSVIDCGGDRLLICDTRCERGLRPMGCRMFPLIPLRGMDGWGVSMDARARAMCPLYRSGVAGLDKAFVEAVKNAALTMASEPALESFMRRWARRERQFRENSWL